jgi:hypothetical protein
MHELKVYLGSRHQIVLVAAAKGKIRELFAEVVEDE